MSDATAPVAAGRGCNQDGSKAATCAVSELGGSLLRLGDGDDSLSRPPGAVRADGGQGDDVLMGSADSDTLEGGLGTDVVRAGRGQDVLSDRGGSRDLLDAGPFGFDSLDYSARRRSIRIDLRKGIGGAPGERDRIVGVEGVVGGQGDDVILGDGNRNLFEEQLEGVFSPEGAIDDPSPSPTGDDRFHGRGGNDVVQSLDGTDRIYGGRGRDRLRCNLAVSDRCHLVGGAAGDELQGGAGADLLRGGPGKDRMFGWEGADRLVGGPDSDKLFGEQGSDRLLARDESRDRVVGGSGRDAARTDRGFDRLVGVERLF